MAQIALAVSKPSATTVLSMLAAVTQTGVESDAGSVMLGSFGSTVVAFTTDVPTLQETWGTPFLIGPGSIHVAHTAEERIAKRELRAAVPIYTSMVKRLLATHAVAPGKFQ